MKVAIAASLVGAIVAELPTGAVAGIGAKLLIGAYHSQTIDIWAALIAGSVVALDPGRHGRVRRPAGREEHGRAAGMTRLGLSWQALAALVLCVGAAFGLPLFGAQPGMSAAATAEIFALILAAIAFSAGSGFRPSSVFLLFAATHGAAWLLISDLAGNEGTARLSYFALLAATWLLAWRTVSVLSRPSPRYRAGPGLRAAGHSADLRRLDPDHLGGDRQGRRRFRHHPAAAPAQLLPASSTSLPMLAADVNQTIFKSALDRLCARRIGRLSRRDPRRPHRVLPSRPAADRQHDVGAADHRRRADHGHCGSAPTGRPRPAVVVVMTFFPMLVNTVTGLTASGHMERDLMRTYASSYWQTLFKLRLPAAAPFIFNALKINSTLALIGAIVAEFFGTPIVGMGFRISTEIGLMKVDMAWAEIAVAALAGSVFYGVIALIERATTFWHPSIRGG